MTRATVAATAAVLLGTLAVVSASACTKNTDFDYLLFVQQWPPTQGGPCANNNTRFTLHGLWPSNTGSTQPCFCSSATFDPSAISSLLPTMQRDWPSCDGADDSFWSHEYEKHGTCCTSMAGFQTEKDFFSQVLTLYQKVNLDSALAAAGITPSDSATYTASAIKAAVKSAYGYDSIIECTNGNLDAIQICLDNTLSAITCPSSRDTSCDNGVTFPSD